MSLHLIKFIERIKSAEKRGQREVVLSLTDARDIQSDLTKLLLSFQALQERSQNTDTDTSKGVEISGGAF